MPRVRLLDVEVERRGEGREGDGAGAVERRRASRFGASVEGRATEREARPVCVGPDRDCGRDAEPFSDARSDAEMENRPDLLVG